MLSEQVSLPLLSSLPFETTTPLLHCVFSQCAAERTIRNFLRSRIASSQKHQGHSTRETLSLPSVNALPFRRRRTVTSARDHFLFQALYSNSLPIRQNASLQLIRAADNADRILILTSVLWDMVQDEMDDFLNVASDRGSLVMTPSELEEGQGARAQGSSSSTSSSSSSSWDSCEFLEAERVVQMYGLLVHYVTEHNERFYSFLLQGGLDWVCQRVLALVSLLIVPSR